MLTSHEFKKSLRRLVLDPVRGLDLEDRLVSARQCLNELEVQRAGRAESVEVTPRLDIVPSQPGARPLDEALAPGRGASDRLGLIDGDRPGHVACLLFRLRDLDAAIATRRKIEVRMSAWNVPLLGGPLEPVPELTDVPVTPSRITTSAYPRPAFMAARWEEFTRTTFVARVAPWRRSGPEPRGDAPPVLANRPRSVLVELQVWIDGVARTFDTTELEIFDMSRLGSLYARTIERLAAAAPAEQAWLAGLRMLADRSAATVRAVAADLEFHRRAVPDPAWSLRMNLELERLTCLAVAEVARAQYPDLLGPEERRILEHDRPRTRPQDDAALAAWGDAWALRGRPDPARRTLLPALLRAHLLELRRALALAAPTDCSEPEVWHRLARDYERAVLWASFTTSGGSDGDTRPITAACLVCRRGLNEAASWARAQGLVHFHGSTAIPAGASLWGAMLRGDAGLAAELQRRDGEVDLPPAPGVVRPLARPLAAHVAGARRSSPSDREVRSPATRPPAAQSDMA